MKKKSSRHGFMVDSILLIDVMLYVNSLEFQREKKTNKKRASNNTQRIARLVNSSYDDQIGMISLVYTVFFLKKAFVFSLNSKLNGSTTHIAHLILFTFAFFECADEPKIDVGQQTNQKNQASE